MSTKNGDSHKTVFITGAAGGLGASTARYLAEHDWMVFAADYDAKALEELENEMRQMERNMGMFSFKSASGEAMKKDMEKKIEKLGRDVERLKGQHRELLKELR